MAPSSSTQSTIPLASKDASKFGVKIHGDSDQWLAVSPYTDRPHLLDFSATEPAQGLLAEALTQLTPIREDFATAAYSESFNWTQVMLALKALITTAKVHWKPRIFFVVIFRSQVKTATDRSHLGELDRRSHAEAMSGGGLLKYWFGIPDGNNRNLATCVWNRFEDAQRGARGERHRDAARATADLYSEWQVERLGLEIGENVNEWSFTKWKGESAIERSGRGVGHDR